MSQVALSKKVPVLYEQDHLSPLCLGRLVAVADGRDDHDRVEQGASLKDIRIIYLCQYIHIKPFVVTHNDENRSTIN
jgi:hypothetical protein